VTIKTTGDVLNMTPGDADHREKFDVYLTARAMKRIENMYRSNVPLTVVGLARMEIDGGKCPKCNVEWERVEYDNLFAKGMYYYPRCECYIKCPRCLQSLHEEEEAGSLKNNCPNCGWELFHLTVETHEDGEVRHVTTKRHGRTWAERLRREREDWEAELLRLCPPKTNEGAIHG